MPNQKDTPWTTNLEARLREMRANGDSFGVIAADLQMTRSMIAGKCKRLGLRFAPTPARRSRSAPVKPRAAATPAAPPVEPLRLLLGQLRRANCRWVGDDSTFCGHDTGGGSYCAYHSRLVYRRAA
jgi:hypothetical protein